MILFFSTEIIDWMCGWMLSILKKAALFIYYDLAFTILVIFTHGIITFQKYLSILFWIGFFLTIFQVGYWVIKQYGFLEKINFKFWLTFISLCVVKNIFVLYHLSQEKTIHFWDSSLYWIYSINTSNNFFSNFNGQIKDLYYSINNNDYNTLPTLILALPMKLFGGNYQVYTLSVLNLYILPTLLLTILLIRKILNDSNLTEKPSLQIISILVPFLFVPFDIPLFNGFLDSAGMIFIILLLMMIYSDNFIRFSITRNSVFTFLLMMLIFTRRWYVFFAVGLIASFFLISTLNILHQYGKYRWKLLLIYVGNILSTGILCLIISVVFFKNFLIRSILNNYVLAYSAYQKGNFTQNLWLAIQYFGPLFILIMIIGAVLLLYSKKGKKFILILLMELPLTFCLFIRIQSFSDQHYYLLSVQLCVLLTIGIVVVLSYLNRVYLKNSVKIVLIFAIIYNYSQTFIPELNIYRNSFVLSNYTVYPQVRNDIPQLDKMAHTLNKLTSGSSERIYLLSSSFTLNSSILKNLYLPSHQNAIPALYTTHDVDLRDGFPNEFFRAKYVLVADPVQYHLRPDNQLVIGALANLFLRSKRIDNFKLLHSYRIDNNVTVKLFKRTGPFKRVYIDKIRKIFREHYKNNPFLTKIDVKQ